MTLQADCERLYSAVWAYVPLAIAKARRWGGDWYEVSTPFLIRRGGKIVAHAGVIDCQFAIDGVSRQVTAIHGVCVHPEFRGRGLGRAVIEQALADIDQRGAKTVILWSEKTALYERFGFAPSPEHLFVAPAPAGKRTAARRCDVDQPDDLEILRAGLRARKPVSSIVAAFDPGWHFLIDLALWTEAAEVATSDLLAILPDHGGIMVFEVAGVTLRLYDFVGEVLPPVADLVGAAQELTGKAITQLEIYFTPDRLQVAAAPRPHPDEDILMVRGEPLVGPSSPPFALSPLTRT